MFIETFKTCTMCLLSRLILTEDLDASPQNFLKLCFIRTCDSYLDPNNKVMLKGGRGTPFPVSLCPPSHQCNRAQAAAVRKSGAILIWSEEYCEPLKGVILHSMEADHYVDFGSNPQAKSFSRQPQAIFKLNRHELDRLAGVPEPGLNSGYSPRKWGRT